MSEEGDATAFKEAFSDWCKQWHLDNRWQHVAALQTLVSMTQGWKSEDLTTLDSWTLPTERLRPAHRELKLTPVHRELRLPPLVWIPTEQAWAAFQRDVRSRVKEELARFKKEAEAQFEASRLERIKSKRSDPKMRDVLRFQIEGKTKEEADAHFGRDELERIESKPTALPVRILIRFQIDGWKKARIIDEFWSDELCKLTGNKRVVAGENLDRRVRRSDHLEHCSERSCASASAPIRMSPTWSGGSVPSPLSHSGLLIRFHTR